MEARPNLKTTNERIDAVWRALGKDEESFLPTKPVWQKLYERIINHKGTSLILAVVLCGFGIIGKYWLDHRNDGFNAAVDSRVQQVLTAKGGIKETLEEVQKTTLSTDATLKTLTPFIQDVVRHQFENASQLPTKALLERLPAVRNLLSVAKDQRVQISPPVLSSIGDKLVNVSSQDPGAWNTALAFMGYKTSFNDLSPSFPYLGPATNYVTKYTLSGPAGESVPKLQIHGSIDAAHSAKLNAIGVDPNRDVANGPIFISAHGGSLTIDGMQIKKVIFYGTRIFYSGGSLQMEDVYFVNCTFEMDSNENGYHLAVAVLSPGPATEFQAM